MQVDGGGPVTAVSNDRVQPIALLSKQDSGKAAANQQRQRQEQAQQRRRVGKLHKNVVQRKLQQGKTIRSPVHHSRTVRCQKALVLHVFVGDRSLLVLGLFALHNVCVCFLVA